MSDGVSGPRFGILGPLRIDYGPDEVVIGSARQRALLAALLVNANTVVPLHQLARYLWDEEPPASALTALRTHVVGLRKVLRDRGGPAAAGRIITMPQGYLLDVRAGELDADAFDELAARAQRALAEGRFQPAWELFDAALRLWRGPALAGVESALLARVEVPRLEERRLRVLEQRVETDLGMGRAAEVVGELTSLVAAHPLRERLRAQLMRALDGSQRRAEALAVYQDTRRTFVDELGLEPGPELQRLHQDILAGTPPARGDTPPPPAAGTRPAELPPDVSTFTGRETELRRLVALLTSARTPGAMPVVAIDGPGGVGKSALAVHVAHAVADHFPDGQLYVNLQGATAGLAPLRPAQVLGRWLRALGVGDAETPTEPQEAAARFRSLTAHRRVLVVLDDAVDAGQVQPLLPASPTGAVLVTSRRILATLDATAVLHLDVLPEEAAVALLGRLAGARRLAAESAAAVTVARLCDRLPLAVRVAGARLAARPDWPVRALADRLAAQHRRLDELHLADLAVRTSFAVSYQELGADPAGSLATRLFRLLALLDGPDVSAPIAAALIGPETVPEGGAAVTDAALELLVDSHLVESPAPGRYRMHDLIRLFARERAAREEPEAVRTAAVRRALDCYLATARQVSELLWPDDPWGIAARLVTGVAGIELADRAAAIAWIDVERDNLLAAARQAAEVSPPVVMDLAGALYRPFDVRGHWPELIALNRLAADTGARTGDRYGQAQALRALGTTYGQVGRLTEEVLELTRSLALFRELGDRTGEAIVLNAIGLGARRQRRYESSVDYLGRGLALFRELGDRSGEARVLGNLGTSYQSLRRFDEAVGCHEESLRIFREVGDADAAGLTVGNLAEAHRLAGRPAEAVEWYERAVAAARQTGDLPAQAEFVWYLGHAHHDLGRDERARTCWAQALDILQALGAVSAEETDTLLDQPVPDTPQAIQLNT